MTDPLIEPIAEPGFRQGPRFVEYDPRAVEIARRIIGAATALEPTLIVEHIGSTAIPDCPGKGYVDMMVVFSPGQLDRAREVLGQLGFRELGDEIRHLFPADRPVFAGWLRHGGDRFFSYLHVVAQGQHEVERFRRFRDRVRRDAQLRRRYIDLKRSIVADGARSQDEYNAAKEALIREILGADYEPPGRFGHSPPADSGGR